MEAKVRIWKTWKVQKNLKGSVFGSFVLSLLLFLLDSDVILQNLYQVKLEIEVLLGNSSWYMPF